MEEGRLVLPEAELHKMRHVLRLPNGAQIALLPGDGRILRCELQRSEAVLIADEGICPGPKRHVTLAQAIPKNEKLDEVVRMGSEMGVARFLVFPSARTVQRWDDKKLGERLRRLQTIAQEASEVCGRGTLPVLETREGLGEVLKEPGVIVLSESDREGKSFDQMVKDSDPVTLVIGPEGGWDAKEFALIGDRGASLGGLVFRVDTAAAAAVALALLAG